MSIPTRGVSVTSPDLLSTPKDPKQGFKSPRSTRLAKRTRKNHTKMDRVESLLNEFGVNLTKAQLRRLESVIEDTSSDGSSPIYSKGKKKRPSTLGGTNAPKSHRAFFNFGRSKEKKKRKRKPVLEDSQQPINLREIEICQQIGAGASSAGVFLCIVDGWCCAMKQLKRELVGKIDIKCFEREMDILYRLPPHPNIVRYLFHTSHGSDLCLFMQLYDGTLRDYLDERRATQDLLGAEIITEMALEIAQGIKFLHDHTVIHRDIKSGNIFMTRNDQGEITKLSVGDFDTSLRLEQSNAKLDRNNIQKANANSFNSNLFASIKKTKKPPESSPKKSHLSKLKRRNFAQNKPRSTVGTAGFMAPEVLGSKNSKPYGFKADSKKNE